MKFWGLVVAGTLALLVAACQQKVEPTMKVEETPAPVAQTEGPPPVADPYATDTMAPPTGATAGPTRPLPPETKGGRTHVVAKGDTLFKLARKYYGDERKWKEIWEANKTRVPNRDKLEVGTKLIIP